MQSNDRKTIERVYNYICNYINQNQISPSVRDICLNLRPPFTLISNNSTARGVLSTDPD